MQKRMIILVLFLGILFFFTNEVSNFFITLEQEKETIYNKNQEIYQTMVGSEYDALSSIAILLSRDQKVKEAYRKNNPNIIQESFKEFWEKVKKESLLSEIQFFANDSSTFINFTKTKEQENTTRCDISWSISNVQNSFHTLFCSNYAGLRATYPILSDSDEVIGGLSVGKEIGSFPQKMKKITSLDTFLVYSKDAARALTNSSFKAFVENKKIVGEYILAEHTLSLDPKKMQSIDFSKKIQTIRIEEKQYFLNILQIKDFQNKNIAYLCTLNGMDKLYSSFYKNMLKNLFLIMAVSILLYVILKGKITHMKEEISIIKNIADNLKRKEFQVLDDVDTKKLQNSSDELKSLLYDIIQMGNSIKSLTYNLEEKVRVSVEKVIQSQKIMLYQSKLASMGEMIDAIAHQWKQPISILKMKIDMLKYDMEDNQIDKEYIKVYKRTSQEQLNHMVNTLDEFRGFLRPDKEVESLEIKKEIDSVLHLLKDDIISHCIEVEVICTDALKIDAIKNEFKHVLINLINNAKDAFVEKEIKNKRITIQVEQDEEEIIIQINDNAGGIPKGVIENIFDANFTTKGKEGTGIGLYLSKLIIEKFGGKISVKNILDGASFEMVFKSSTR
jgi:signal transduction histidine kinase